MNSPPGRACPFLRPVPRALTRIHSPAAHVSRNRSGQAPLFAPPVRPSVAPRSNTRPAAKPDQPTDHWPARQAPLSLPPLHGGFTTSAPPAPARRLPRRANLGAPIPQLARPLSTGNRAPAPACPESARPGHRRPRSPGPSHRPRAHLPGAPWDAPHAAAATPIASACTIQCAVQCPPAVPLATIRQPPILPGRRSLPNQPALTRTRNRLRLRSPPARASHRRQASRPPPQRTHSPHALPFACKGKTGPGARPPPPKPAPRLASFQPTRGHPPGKTHPD